MKKVIVAVAIICSVGFVFKACKSEKKETKKEEVTVVKDTTKVADKTLYQCPMDCEKGKTYEKEGKCPVCKMKLRKKVEEEKTEEPHNH